MGPADPGMQVLMVAKRSIKAGEEVSDNYGLHYLSLALQVYTMTNDNLLDNDIRSKRLCLCRSGKRNYCPALRSAAGARPARRTTPG